MGKIVERKKKKKGRPSLLDLQKRRIKEQAELEQQQQNHKSRSHNPNSNTAITSRRSTRRNSSPNPSEEGEDHEEGQSGRNCPQEKIGRGSSGRGNTDLDGEEDVDNDDDDKEEEEDARSLKKRKINATVHVSGSAEIHKVEKLVSGSGGTNSILHQGIIADGGNGTPLPDKKLLVFVHDQLENWDTYGVFSEPVDPEELPDYHEVIKHPMDFSTVRKKLDGEEYANLEEFESDVFLICSNAMQYNAPDTVYFRQARSIQELAEKSFDNLREDSVADNDGQEPKRRGRPPTKHLKKPVGRPPLDCAGSDNTSGATLATGRENTTWSNYDLRKGSPLEKASSCDSAGRLHLTSGNSEAYNSGWFSQQKLERSNDYTGSQLRGGSYKQGKKPAAAIENRRDTYKHFHPSLAANNTSVFSTFNVEKKMLLPVGLHAEYGYARSLARFAAGLSPVAWGIASKKIEKSLPPKVNFGPGWVGYDDVSTQRPVPINPSSSGQAGASDPFALPCGPSHEALKGHDHMSTYQNEEENSLGYQLASTVAALDIPAAAAAISTPSSSTRSHETSGQSSELNGLSTEGQTHLPQSSINGSGKISPSQFQRRGPTMHLDTSPNHQVNLHPPLSQINMQPKMSQINMQPKMSQDNMLPQMNQYSPQPQANRPNLISQTNQHAGTHQPFPTGMNCNYQQMSNLVSRASPAAVHLMPGSTSASGVSNTFYTNRSSTSNLKTAGPSRQQFYPEPTSETVPPDLNVQFQSSGSPNSSRLDSKHMDLALQL